MKRFASHRQYLDDIRRARRRERTMDALMKVGLLTGGMGLLFVTLDLLQRTPVPVWSVVLAVVVAVLNLAAFARRMWITREWWKP